QLFDLLLLLPLGFPPSKFILYLITPFSFFTYSHNYISVLSKQKPMSTILVLLICVLLILVLLSVLKSIPNYWSTETGSIAQNNASNQTERRDGFIILKPHTPSNNTSGIPKPIERVNGAIIIKPRAPEPVSSTKPAATTHYKPPAVPSVWGSAPRTNPPRAQQQLPIISPSPVTLPPTEYTNSLGIRLQVAPSVPSLSTPTAAPATSATSPDTHESPPPTYERSPKEIEQTHTAITIDDQTPTPSPAQPRHQQQPNALEDIQFSSHPRPNVAIVIQADVDTTTPGSTTI
ncbi:MAG: hypothetical protein JOS17DRAFT_843367, partial [Linnemannia elongata]